MTEVTILKDDTVWEEPIGQGHNIRHLSQRGAFESMDDAEAKRLVDAGLAVLGRQELAGEPAAPAEASNAPAPKDAPAPAPEAPPAADTGPAEAHPRPAKPKRQDPPAGE